MGVNNIPHWYPSGTGAMGQLGVTGLTETEKTMKHVCNVHFALGMLWASEDVDPRGESPSPILQNCKGEQMHGKEVR